MFTLIKAAMFGAEIPARLDEETFAEMQRHAIAALPADLLPSVDMPESLRKAWQVVILQVLSFNAQCDYTEAGLPVSVPYVVLKGTSAARYYPRPDYRSRGDIDIMVNPVDHVAACEDLLGNGFCEIFHEEGKRNPRHRAFEKDGVDVEVHSCFAIATEVEKAAYLDDLIIRGINPGHVLPDPVNGLVLLAHMSQHLEQGLGLRQIIDWMMFVHRCLSDDNWPAFKTMARHIGLEKLAVTATRMCELYLGLPERSWCAGAERALCDHLMDYILSCGNFGGKRAHDLAAGMNVFAAIHSPATLFAQLQRRGLINWMAAKRHPALRPFAWIYQSFRYVRKGFLRANAISSLKEEYREARQREALCEMLGANYNPNKPQLTMSEVRERESTEG